MDPRAMAALIHRSAQFHAATVQRAAALTPKPWALPAPAVKLKP